MLAIIAHRDVDLYGHVGMLNHMIMCTLYILHFITFFAQLSSSDTEDVCPSDLYSFIIL